MDGKKIDSRRIIVDAERGRTETDWLPRYLGGGLGGHRRAANTRPDEKLGAIKTNNFVRTEREREHTTEKRDREDRFQSRDKGRDNENSRNNNNFQYRDRRRSRSRHDSQRRYKEDDKRKKERKH
ncbi:hypothetical protein HZS_2092 [Henneguya salminicola]|nr:hypothetical protein HZS_2092 [Henneguya salminicola]